MEKDLELTTSLDVNFHYNTHGDQLIDLEMLKMTLEAVKKSITEMSLQWNIRCLVRKEKSIKLMLCIFHSH